MFYENSRLEKGLNVSKLLKVPENYLLGYLADKQTFIEQIEYNAKEEIHYGK